MANTLPFLDRIEEARTAAEKVRALVPGFSREDAVEAHRRWCFDEAYFAHMDEALAMAGLPSRAPASAGAP